MINRGMHFLRELIFLQSTEKLVLGDVDLARNQGSSVFISIY